MKERALSRPRTLLFFAAVLAISNLLLLSRFEPRDHLTREERGDDLRRLTELAARTHVGGAPGRIVQRTLTFEDCCGTPGGLVVATQIDRNGRAAGPETQLRFFLGVDAGPLWDGTGDSSRVFMTRSDRTVDLVARRDPGTLWMELSNLGVPAQEGRANLLVNNLRNPRQGRALGSAPMPSLQRLLRGRHCKLTPGDLDFFQKLRSVTRARICDDLDVISTRCYAPVILLARDLRPGEYILRLAAGDPRLGSLDLRLAAVDGAEGEPSFLVTYSSRKLITLRRPANLFFVRPAPSGELLSWEAPGVHGLRFDPQKDPSPDLRGTIQLATLLSNGS